MLLAFEFFESRSAAEQTAISGVKLARYFLTQISIGEAHAKLIRVHEACTNYLDDGTARSRAASWLEFKYSNWGVENNRVLIGEDICEDSMLCVGIDHCGNIDLRALVAHSNVSLTPRVGSSSCINHVCSILRALDLDDGLELIAS